MGFIGYKFHVITYRLSICKQAVKLLVQFAQIGKYLYGLCCA